MDRDIVELLERTSTTPQQDVDPAALRQIAQRRRSRRGFVAATSVVGIALLALPVIGGLPSEPTLDVTVADPNPGATDAGGLSFDVALFEPEDWTTPTSQTIEEAIRDGVPPRMANVPTEVRIDVADPDTPGDWPRWSVNPTSNALASSEGRSCGGGVLCNQFYGEALLVDEGGDIVLAHAMPSLGNGSGNGYEPSDGSDDVILAFEYVDVATDEPTGVILMRFGTTPGDRDVLIYPADASSLSSDRPWALAPPGRPLVLPDGWTVMAPGTEPPAVWDQAAVEAALTIEPRPRRP